MFGRKFNTTVRVPLKVPLAGVLVGVLPSSAAAYINATSTIAGITVLMRWSSSFDNTIVKTSFAPM